MRMLLLSQGWNSGTNRALLNAWRRGSPDVHVVARDAARLSVGRFERKVRLALGRWGLPGHRGRDEGQMKRSKWYLGRMADALSQPAAAAGCDVALLFGTTIPATVLPVPYYLYTDHTILSNLYYPDGDEHVGRWESFLAAERRTINQAQAVFTMSRHINRSLREQYGQPPEKIHLVGVGCNVPEGASPATDRYASGEIVFVGVDWDRKGGPQLLEAFERVRNRHPHARLTIIGCRPKATGPRVRVLGPTSQRQTAQYLAAAAVFCLPSLREPFGIAFLEAMRAGAPAVGLDLGATPDFIVNGKTGYRVPAGDVDALTDRLDRLLSDPDACRCMGERARKLVQDRYTWELVHKRMARVMASFAGGIETTAKAPTDS